MGLFFCCQIPTRVDPRSIFAQNSVKGPRNVHKKYQDLDNPEFWCESEKSKNFDQHFCPIPILLSISGNKNWSFQLVSMGIFFRSKIGSRVDPWSIFCWKSVKGPRNVIKKFQHPDNPEFQCENEKRKIFHQPFRPISNFLSILGNKKKDFPIDLSGTFFPLPDCN